jgi:hypothetical protein
MQLQSVAIARSIWLFDINELNPSGKSIFPEAFIWLGEKYSFQTFPKSVGEIDQEKKGYLFKAGKFQIDGETITVNFSIYSDGFVAETWASTEKGDALLEDILRSAASKYGLTYRPGMVRTKQYVSELNVCLDSSLSSFNPQIARFCETLNGLFARHHLPQFDMTGVIFSPDTSATSYKPPGLMIERKTGVPFAENRYWSKSPFATADHLMALGEFESLLEEPTPPLTIGSR